MLQKEVFRISGALHSAGAVVFEWDHAGKFLATCGANKRVHIFDRNGDVQDEFPLVAGGPCMMMAWDCDDETLAVLQEVRMPALLAQLERTVTRFVSGTSFKER
eukprot:227256_1